MKRLLFLAAFAVLAAEASADCYYRSSGSCTEIDPAVITTGQPIPPAKMGTGEATTDTFLRGDGQWAAPPAGNGGLPAGAIILILSGTCPAGFSEVPALSGKVIIGTTALAGDVGTSGGSDTITPQGTNSAPTFTGQALGTHAHGTGTYATSAHAGSAVADHASHTHTYTEVLNHTHTVSVTDPGHNHTQNAHTHTQMSITSTTGSVGGYEHGTADASSTVSDEINPDALVAATTATNNSATTGISASTANPGGGTATGTTAGPSATLSHQVTQPNAHTLSGNSEATSAGTPAGTVSAPTFTGSQFDNRSAWVKAIFCAKS
jgi:hypothetical protein